MNNTEKKLDALIDALGFDVEEVDSSVSMYKLDDLDRDGDPYKDANPITISKLDYKLTKRNHSDEEELYQKFKERILSEVHADEFWGDKK